MDPTLLSMFDLTGKAAIVTKVPLGRLGKLEELEAAVVYLASSASDYMTGQSLILDGGFLAW